MRSAADAAGARPGARTSPAPAATSRSWPRVTTGSSCSPSSSRSAPWRTADGGRARGSALGGCRQPRLPRLRGRRMEPHPVRLVVTYREDLRRDHPLRTVLGRSRDVGRAAAARLEPLERRGAGRDARGADGVGSERGASAERRRSVRGDRLIAGGARRTDISARHRPRPCGACSAKRSARAPRCRGAAPPKAPMPRFSAGADGSRAPRLRWGPASSRDCSCTTVGEPWRFGHELARQVIDRTSITSRGAPGSIAASSPDWSRPGTADAAVSAHHAEQGRRCGRSASFRPPGGAGGRRRWDLTREVRSRSTSDFAVRRWIAGSRRGLRCSTWYARRAASWWIAHSDALEVSADALACWRESGDLRGLGTSFCNRVWCCGSRRRRGSGTGHGGPRRSRCSSRSVIGAAGSWHRRTRPQRDSTLVQGSYEECLGLGGLGLELAESKKAMRRRSPSLSRWGALA